MDGQRITTDEPDLSVVLGELSPEQRTELTNQLTAADATLVALRDDLAERSGRDSWTTTGIAVEELDSGQTRIFGVVEDAEDGLTFTVELRPHNFFTEGDLWQPGKPPRVMATDAWDVEGEVLAMTEMQIADKKHMVEETVHELRMRRYSQPERAVSAFCSMWDELAELARQRDPQASAWHDGSESE